MIILIFNIHEIYESHDEKIKIGNSKHSIKSVKENIKNENLFI